MKSSLVYVIIHFWNYLLKQMIIDFEPKFGAINLSALLEYFKMYSME